MQAPDLATEQAVVAGRPDRLRKRSQFLAVAGGRKSHAALFTVQMRPQAGDVVPARVGLTVTKKVGGAAERNRIRRRLREVLRLEAGLGLQPGHDYVIVARRDLLSAPFGGIAAGLRASVAKVHGAAPKHGGRRAPS